MRSVISRSVQAATMAIATIAVSVEAQPMGGNEYLSIRAATDYSGMHPGQRGLLAIDLVCDEGWHTYWPGVSDTGYGVSFNIETAESIELKDPIWPSPQRYLQRGGILDHTYEGTQTVLIPFVVSADATVDTPIAFDITANFLVCKEMCLPGQLHTTASLTVVDKSRNQTESSRHQELSTLYESRPIPFKAKDQAVRLQWIDKAAAVMFRDATRIEFYPDTECTPMESVIEDGASEGNRLEVRFAESEDKVLSGRLRVTTRDGVVHYDIDERAP